MERFPDILARVPKLPGVYLYRDRDGKVIYVGKARDLRKRVRQYFQKRAGGRLGLLVSRIESIETMVAGTEKEALLLEATLIKRYRPHFNLAMKDDKSYPSFRLTVQEEFPRLELTRKIVRDGSLYFGPFPNAAAARGSAEFLLKAFPLRRCKGSRPGGRTRKGRACLDYQMGRCLGPCLGTANEEEYRRRVEELTAFLKGKGREVIAGLKKEMKELSASLRFEEAAALRDRILALATVVEGQRMVGDPGEDADALGFAAEGEATLVSCLFVRSGLLVGKRDMLFAGVGDAEEAVDAFLAQHYQAGAAIPPAILFPLGLSFRRSYQEVLSERAGRKVEVSQPIRGKGWRLLSLAAVNAREGLREAVSRRESATALASELAKALHLPIPPRRIECVDVSHTAGKEPYASVVAWKEGNLARDDYRLFGLRETDPGDDFAGLAEAIRRRLTGSVSETLPAPDLLLVDGGRGQLSRVTALLGALGKGGIGAVSISKGRTERRRSPGSGQTDEVWLPGRANPLKLARGSRTLRLLQQLRDEAHRFALGAHRRRRGKEDLMSALDGIPGVGPIRRRALLTRFRSLGEIAAAPAEEIAKVKGLTPALAERVKAALRPLPG